MTPVLKPQIVYMLRESNRLLKMREEMRARLGAQIYAQRTGEYAPFIASQLAIYGCPRIAADHVIAVLDPDLAIDPEVQRLVKCAALDAVLNETPISSEHAA